jgi:predicted P-type ATPase
MLRGAVRQPITMKDGRPANSTLSATSSANNDTRNRIGIEQQQHYGGREKIIPLTRRSTLQRLDVYPLLLGFASLILADVFLRTATTDGRHDDQSLPTLSIVLDVVYILLLLSQLVLFLKCQWNPVWRAKIAYRQYSFVPPPLSASNGSTPQKQVAMAKIHDMKRWTHCLIIPPNPYDDVGQGGEGGKARRTAFIRREHPGIAPLSIETSLNGGVASTVAVVHFRGWTYRCCCNYASNGGTSENEHTDIPMERIWKGSDETLRFDMEDIDDEVDTNDFSTTSFSWEPQFHRLHFPIDLPLSFYMKWQGHHANNDNSTNTLDTTTSIFNKNTTPIPLPALLSLLMQQLLQPLFLFQLFCVILWSMDEYWMYAIFTLCSLIMFELAMAYNRWKGVKRLREEVVGADVGGGESEANGKGKHKRFVECYRMGKWTSIATNELVVGDIISLVSPSVSQRQQQQSRKATIRNAHDHERGSTIAADLLLLSGRAVVEESMLTGESVPQVKESIGNEINNGDKKDVTALDLSDGSAHKRSVLFGGTVLVDHHSDVDNAVNNDAILPPPNQGLVCFVLRTGFDTIQGQLLRTMAYHAESIGNNSGGGEGVNASETFIFLVLLLMCALVSAITVLEHAWGDVTRNHFKLILHVIIIITSVIPPELPMELSLAVTTSLSELIKRYQIYCSEPFRIPIAGLVDTCCFDKTGTLTSDELRLHGVRLPTQQQDTTEVEESGDLVLLDHLSEVDSRSAAIRSILPRETLRVMVGCQSLAITHAFVTGRDGRTTVQTELCGDPLEKAVMATCGWTLHPAGKGDTVVEEDGLAVRNWSSSSPTTIEGTITVLHRFAFSSKLRRMTALAIDTDDDKTLWALTKGAPEALHPMLDPKSLPSDYVKSYTKQMAKGRRVLAMAYRDLGASTPSNLTKWKSREKVEQNLIFAGLLVMECPLKFDSKRVVKELRDGNQEVVMVTGDAVLTAAEVARCVGIIDASEESTYELCSVEKEFSFLPLGREVNTAKENGKGFSYTPENIAIIGDMVRNGKAAVCMTGDILSKLAIASVEKASLDKTALVVDERTALNHPAALSELSSLIPIVSVFARHAPRHKEAIVAAFNASG